MARALIRGVTLRLAAMALLTVVAFGLAHAAPGDPAELILRGAGSEPTPQAVAAMRIKLGLDRPLPLQYLGWLGHALRLDFGTSFASGQPVSAEFLDRLPATLELTGAALLITAAGGLGAGLLTAGSRRWTAGVVRAAAVVGSAAPSYWLGLLGISLFSVRLGWLPTAGLVDWKSLVLPAFALAIGYAPLQARLLRASLVLAMSEQFSQVARGKGFSPRAVLVRHALPRALGPNIQALGLAAGQMLGGAIVVETVFAWPGVGRLAADSIFRRDYPVIETYFLVLGTGYILMNLLADVIHAWLDPTAREALLAEQ